MNAADVALSGIGGSFLTAVSVVVGAIEAEAFALIIAAIFGSTGIGAFLTYRSTSRKSNADAENVTGDTYRELVSVLREELREERRSCDEAMVRKDAEIAALRERVAVLEHRLDSEHASDHARQDERKAQDDHGSTSRPD